MPICMAEMAPALWMTHVHRWKPAQIDEITLLNTVLIKWDGLRIICPNNKLSMDLLINVTRSQKKGETFKVSGVFHDRQWSLSLPEP